MLFAPVLAQAAPKPDYGDITKPEFFPILPWDQYHGWTAPFIERTTNGLDSIAACNFNFAGFVQPRDLGFCHHLGLGGILLAEPSLFTNKTFYREWRKLSGEQIEQRVRQIIKAGGHDSSIKGYFIMDEPSVLDFPALGQAVAAVKKYAPGKFAYINLYPDYAVAGATNLSQLGTSNYTEYLERFVREVQPQFLSYDNYKVELSQDLQDTNGAANYFRNLLAVRRAALENHLPYLNIVSANQLRPYTTIPSPANLAFQAYTTLAAGYRGVGWFTYYARNYHYAAVDAAGQKTPTWYRLQEINREIAALAPVMSRLHSSGVFFTSSAAGTNLPALPGKLIASVNCSTPLLIGEFADDMGKAYAMVVNLSLEKSAKFMLKTVSPYGGIRIISTTENSGIPYDQKAGQWLVAGEGVLLAFDR